jgi:hypothetical protein
MNDESRTTSHLKMRSRRDLERVELPDLAVWTLSQNEANSNPSSAARVLRSPIAWRTL